MFTVTSNTILPCTITGSWPRPRWFDMSMWGSLSFTWVVDNITKSGWIYDFATNKETSATVTTP